MPIWLAQKQFWFLGSSFLKSSDEKDDSEMSRKSFSETDLTRKFRPDSTGEYQPDNNSRDSTPKSRLDLSPKKSILKTSPSKQQQQQQQQHQRPKQQQAQEKQLATAKNNNRANLIAKDDRKIHFNLNENLQLYSEVRNIQSFNRPGRFLTIWLAAKNFQPIKMREK